ncbi:MAG: PQQ-binding-like beta-propeller repeat protein [Spirochaetia bacterium]
MTRRFAFILSLIILCLISGAGIFAEELDKIQESWKHATGGAITGIARDEEGRIFAASEDRYLYRFDSGGELLSRALLREKPAGGIVFLPDGTLCVLLRRGIAHVNARGKEIWFYPTETSPVGGVSADRYGYIYYTTESGRVESLSHTGRLRWRLGLDVPMTSGFTLDPSSGRGVVAAGNTVHCLSFTGSEKWRRSYTGYTFFSSRVIGEGLFALVAPEGIVLVDDRGTTVQEITFSTVRNIKGIFSTGENSFFLYSRSGFLWELQTDGDTGGRYYSRDAWYLADAGGLTDIILEGRECVIGTESWLVHGYELPFRVIGLREGPGYDIYSSLGNEPGFLYIKALEETGSRRNAVRIMDEIEGSLDVPAGENGPAYLLALESISHGRNPDTPLKTGGYARDGIARARAVDLLGILGNLSTIRMLRIQAAGETHPEVILSLIGALGRLSSDPEGKSIAVIDELSDRNNRVFRDPRIAAATVKALERIDRYQPSRHRREFVSTLLSIFYGNYPREVRENAMTVLELSP